MKQTHCTATSWYWKCLFWNYKYFKDYW